MVTGSSPLFHRQRVRLGFTRHRTCGAERTHKGSMGCFGRCHDIRQLRNHTWDSFRMGSGVIYYEHEKRKKFEDYDLKADAELGTFKIRRYHFDDESFVHPLHSVRFDPDSPNRGADG
ncbi:hypothetical protein PIB30_097069 [Stylosanthes scabra]|uniref:Uncharacterized protein n=1 Tax=Stylosanthes scabra TaxID=79078 RepID=A0ABU6VX14_9FABA|nr:hypothetical protein [Stylosanthes scabra]